MSLDDDRVYEWHDLTDYHRATVEDMTPAELVAQDHAVAEMQELADRLTGYREDDDLSL